VQARRLGRLLGGSLSGTPPSAFCVTLRRGPDASLVPLGTATPVGKAHAMFVIDSVAPDHVSATATADARLVWIGEDDRGIELEIVALDLADAVVVIHVMPTALRRP